MHRVVVFAPLLDQDTGLGQGVERLARQQLVTELAVEALHVAVLPGTTRLGIRRSGDQPGDPVLDRGGHELRPVARRNRADPATDRRRAERGVVGSFLAESGALA